MNYKAVFLDFYGTLVAEDELAIRDIVTQIVQESGVKCDSNEISFLWHKYFRIEVEGSVGTAFRTQKEIQINSLHKALRELEINVDPSKYAEELFEYSKRPEKFSDSDEFLSEIGLPVCIVSNIDNDFLMEAISFCDWNFENVVTSESCRAYKPNRFVFQTALDKIKLKTSQVLHVGDSISSDFAGAREMGIDFAWLNRSGRKLLLDAPVPKYQGGTLNDLQKAIEEHREILSRFSSKKRRS